MMDERDDARADEELLAEQEQIRIEGHAPVDPVVPGLSAAEFEAELMAVRRLADEGEFGAVYDALGAVIDRLQRRPMPGAVVPEWRPEPVTDRQRHQRAAVRGVITTNRLEFAGVELGDVSDEVIDEIIAAVEAGF
jgi:3-hydroxymyristoyl/3-hydroxydecanoyl-(acyl carrier protein) dehydratase